MNGPGIPVPQYLSTAAPLPPGALTFGQLLDRIFSLMRSNFRLFVGIAAVPVAGMAAFYALIIAIVVAVIRPWQHPEPAEILPMLGRMFAAVFVVYLLLMVIYALYEAAGSYAALQANAGVRVTFGQSWAMAFRKAGRYIWLAILRTLIVGLPIMVVAGLIAGTVASWIVHAKGNPDPIVILRVFPLFALLYLGSAVYAILILLRIVLAVPACVAENRTAWASICRSNQLTRGARGRIFLLGLLLYAITYVAMMAVELVVYLFVILALAVGAVAHLTIDPWGFVGIGILVVIFLCGLFAVMASIAALYCTAIVAVYHDQRLRNESIAAAPAV